MNSTSSVHFAAGYSLELSEILIIAALWLVAAVVIKLICKYDNEID